MLAKWDPFSDFARLHEEFFGGSQLLRGVQAQPFRPSVDIYEDEAGIHIKAELAGVKKEDLKLELENGVLTIRGERKLEHVNEEAGYRRVERSHGSFARSFKLAADVTAEEINADYRDGVLSVLVPKKAGNGRREITVTSH